MLAVVCVVLAAAGVSAQKAPPVPGDAIRGVVKSYLEIQAALAEDRFADLKAPAGTLSSQAAAMGKDATALARAATTFAAAADLAAARDAFGPLSDAVIARVKADGSGSVASELKLAYCPMVRKSWLQLGDQVRNPYYGKSMPTCGELKPVK